MRRTTPMSGTFVATALAMALHGGHLATEGRPEQRLEPPPHDPDGPPRRLSSDERSPHYDPCYLRVDVMLDGVLRPKDVEEYDLDGGWLRTTAGRVLRGDVEATWRQERTVASSPALSAPYGGGPDRAEAARLKQERKAAKRLRDAP